MASTLRSKTKPRSSSSLLGWFRAFPSHAPLASFLASALSWVYLSPLTSGHTFYKYFETRALPVPSDQVESGEQALYLNQQAFFFQSSGVDLTQDLSLSSPEDLTYRAPLRRFIFAAHAEFTIFKRFYASVVSPFPLQTSSTLFLSALVLSLWSLMAVPKHKRFKPAPTTQPLSYFSLAKRAASLNLCVFWQPLRLFSRPDFKAPLLSLGGGNDPLLVVFGPKQPLGLVAKTGCLGSGAFSSFFGLNHVSHKLGCITNYRGFFFPSTPLFFSAYAAYLGF